MSRLLVFTPTFENGPQPRTMQSVAAQVGAPSFNHHVNWLKNPLPGRDVANVVAHYREAQKMCLDGGYEALVTVEHDMVIPPHALQALYDTDAPVVYATYMLRHGTPALNAWRYRDDQRLGTCLSLYPREVKEHMARGWAKVSGVGWGCTLIRREVLGRIVIRSSDPGDAGDIAFAKDCLHGNILQIARFDVACGHIEPSGNVLEVESGIVARVYALANTEIRGNKPMKIRKHSYYTLPVEVAKGLMQQGLVRVTNGSM